MQDFVHQQYEIDVCMFVFWGFGPSLVQNSQGQRYRKGFWFAVLEAATGPMHYKGLGFRVLGFRV